MNTRIDLDIDQMPADALPFPLCVSSLSETGARITGVSVARGNILLAMGVASIVGQRIQIAFFEGGAR